ncbi:hypothetical protein D3C86_2081690 [compost metagenome]
MIVALIKRWRPITLCFKSLTDSRQLVPLPVFHGVLVNAFTVAVIQFDLGGKLVALDVVNRVEHAGVSLVVHFERRHAAMALGFLLPLVA